MPASIDCDPVKAPNGVLLLVEHDAKTAGDARQKNREALVKALKTSPLCSLQDYIRVAGLFGLQVREVQRLAPHAHAAWVTTAAYPIEKRPIQGTLEWDASNAKERFPTFQTSITQSDLERLQGRIPHLTFVKTPNHTGPLALRDHEAQALRPAAVAGHLRVTRQLQKLPPWPLHLGAQRQDGPWADVRRRAKEAWQAPVLGTVPVGHGLVSARGSALEPLADVDQFLCAIADQKNMSIPIAGDAVAARTIFDVVLRGAPAKNLLHKHASAWASVVGDGAEDGASATVNTKLVAHVMVVMRAMMVELLIRPSNRAVLDAMVDDALARSTPLYARPDRALG